MPNDKIGKRTVVASVYYTDEVATVLLLNPEEPYFSVGQVELSESSPFDPLSIVSVDANIVYAVREYEQWGGDV